MKFRVSDDDPEDPICLALDRVDSPKMLVVDPPWIEPKLAEWIDRLPAKHRLIVQLRFGLGQFGVHSLAEIGAEFNVSRQRIDQVLDQSLEAMRIFSLQRCLKKVYVSELPIPPFPESIRRKMRTDRIQHEVLRISRRARGKRLLESYRTYVDQYGCVALPDEIRTYFKSGWWIVLGKKFWIIFDPRTRPAAMGVDPLALRTELRKIA